MAHKCLTMTLHNTFVSLSQFSCMEKFSLIKTNWLFSTQFPLPGESPKLEKIELHLEDLLELQHLRDPVSSYVLSRYLVVKIPNPVPI